MPTRITFHSTGTSTQTSINVDALTNFCVALLLAAEERGEAVILTSEIIDKAQHGSYRILEVALDDETIRLELIEK